ncbi:MAG TPA: threonine dehydratase [Hyphomicrobiaceae bacterium]|nr:threonine dehydratase [Hyphomicrobiaceae bacterium]
MFTLAELEKAASLVHSRMPPTPTHNWPILTARTGAEVWVKHENHTPIGAFKVRGGIVYIDELQRSGQKVTGVISATRGNHGQSIARAATMAGMRSVIVVPKGNSVEKNAAMRAFGAELVEHGADFDEAKEEAERLAGSQGLHMVPSFHEALVKGVATYALELFRSVGDLDAVFAPIGMGSGVCGLIAARDLLGLKTEIIGVVSENAPAYALSYTAGMPVPTNTARTFADGMAVRGPHPVAVSMICRGAAEIVRVGEDEIADAMRLYYEATHNLAEGAGAASLAALSKTSARWANRKVAVVLSGGNVDRPVFRQVLAGETPSV